jgi:hypothetical protein
MVDVNKIIRNILVSMNLEDVTVCFYHPDEKQELPVISYYENTTTTGFCYDNAEQAQNTAVSIDIWANGGGECSRIAIQVDTAMQACAMSLATVWQRVLHRRQGGIVNCREICHPKTA